MNKMNESVDRPPILPPSPPRRTLPPLLMSMGAHLVLMVLLGVLLTSPPKGTGRPVERPIGIAMAQILPDRTQYTDAIEMNRQSDSESIPPELAAASSAAPPPESLVPPLDMEGLLQSVTASASPASASGIAGMTDLGEADFGTSPNPGEAKSSEQATAMVFGISGSGSRFVYVFDRSDSMNGYQGRPLRAAKSELLRSLESLSDRQRFQIIFYNDKPSAMQVSGGGIDMIDGDEAGMILARRHLQSIAAFGGTEHASAIHMALRMAPDVVFFLTDARIPRLSSSELSLIRRRAHRVGATIHTIEFGVDPISPTNSFVRELAAMNQGQYRYINVQKLNMIQQAKP